MKRFAFPLMFVFLFSSAFTVAQNSDASDPYKQKLDRLEALTRQSETDWRFHADDPHPEDPALNDSNWGTLTVHNISGSSESNASEEHWAGTRVFRRWIQVPEKINGYAAQGSRVSLELKFDSSDGLRMTVFSNGATLYRGSHDDLLPMLLTENAHPGQKFLLAVRVVAKDDQKTSFIHSEITIEPPHMRPNPTLLRMQILSAQPIINAYEQGKPERQEQLDAALKAIDFSPLDRGDQAGFDDSLRHAQDKLKSLKPFLQQFNIRIVGNSHIDMAWLWPWTETVEVVRNTFQSVLDLMREYRNFKFTMSSARTYEWMQEK
jgi:alpha-mannosidase